MLISTMRLQGQGTTQQTKKHKPPLHACVVGRSGCDGAVNVIILVSLASFFSPRTSLYCVCSRTCTCNALPSGEEHKVFIQVEHEVSTRSRPRETSMKILCHVMCFGMLRHGCMALAVWHRVCIVSGGMGHMEHSIRGHE